MSATSVIPAPIQRPSPSVHRVGFSTCFTRLHIGSLALRPALLLLENSRPRVATAPLPHATGAYGQLPRRDFNPLDLLLLLRTDSIPTCSFQRRSAEKGRRGWSMQGREIDRLSLQRHHLPHFSKEQLSTRRPLLARKLHLGKTNLLHLANRGCVGMSGLYHAGMVAIKSVVP